MTCRLASICGGPGNGVWRIPDVGTEVVVAFPGGDPAAGGILLATLGSADLNGGVDDTGKILIIAPQVLIYESSSGDAQPLPTMAEFINHQHPTAFGPSGPPIDPITPGAVGPILGTTVLKAQ